MPFLQIIKILGNEMRIVELLGEENEYLKLFTLYC